MFDAFELNLIRHDLKGLDHLNICPVGDNHDDVGAYVDDHLADLKKRTAKMKPNEVLFIGMGDYGDFASTSERASIKSSKLHDTTIERLDDLAMKDLIKRVKQFEFMKGRLIGLHNGNHDWHFQDGQSASEKMAQMLECKHLGYCAYTKISVNNVCRPSPDTRSFVDIFSSHGKAGGRLLGSPWNTLEQMSRVFHDADLYLMGHDHSKGGLPDTRLYVELNKRSNYLELREKVRCFMRTGSAMRGYESGKKSYVSKALMKPCSLGFPMAIVEWKRTQSKGCDSITKTIHSWN